MVNYMYIVIAHWNLEKFKSRFTICVVQMVPEKTKMANVYLKVKGNVVQMVPEKTKMANVYLK